MDNENLGNAHVGGHRRAQESAKYTETLASSALDDF